MPARYFLLLYLLVSPVQAGERGHLSDVVDRLGQQWPNNRAITIVAHGHSVPAGYSKTPAVAPFDAYPHLLHVALHRHWPTAVINVIVTARGGETSEDGAKRFSDVLAHKPDVMLIDYGLNDRNIGLARARAAWVGMIEQAKAYGAKVVLLTPTPDIDARLDDPGDALNQHAEQIRSLAVEHGLGLADSLAAFRQQSAIPALMAQSNHPNRRGHELVVGRLMALFVQGKSP